MIGYPFINEFFSNVLQYSSAIAGRFHICPQYGNEINTEQLGMVLDATNDPVRKKYPMALMMPPSSKGDFGWNQPGWKALRIVMFFMKTTYYDGNNQVSNPNEFTGTSGHTIPQDWHDMERAAVNFIRVVDRKQRTNLEFMKKFRVDACDVYIQPVSLQGVDRISGVKLDFKASIFVGCELEDYDIDQIALITLPTVDSHPEHLPL